MYAACHTLRALLWLGVLPKMPALGVYVGSITNFAIYYTCTVLSFYSLQVLSVKILLESETPQMLKEKARKHQRNGLIFVSLMASCLYAFSIAVALD